MEDRVAFCYELIACSYDLCRWIYDEGGTLLETTRENPRLFHSLFTHYGSIEAMLAHGRAKDTPMLLSMPIGLYAIAVFEKSEGVLRRVHVLGPAFSTDVPKRAIDEGILALTDSPQEQLGLKGVVYTLPLVTPKTLNQYGLMLHYALSGERLGISDIVPQRGPEVEAEDVPEEIPRDRHQTWLVERGILHMVREGNLGYAGVLTSGQEISTGVRMQTGEPLRQAKVTAVVFISLCTRAAIEGGVSADRAYAIGDGYIQATELCNSNAELNAQCHAMYEEFIRTVREAKAGPAYSRVVRTCVDYIEMHVEKAWTMKQLADHVGYTPYYLTTKFKKEVGVSVSAYSRKARMQQAKVLLTSTELSILEIAERLQFTSRSFFSETFLKEVGETPVAYRQSAWE